MQALVQAFQNWFMAPFSGKVPLWQLVFFLVMTIAVAIIWSRVILHVTETTLEAVEG